MSTSSSSNTKKHEYRIGDVTTLTGFSADTLRYYEKIGLLRPIARTESGVRVYVDRDLSSLRFIRRAKSMNFSLDEITQMLQMRQDPQHAADDVRQLSNRKLLEIEAQMESLGTLRDELKLLINLCRGAEDGCPIIDEMDSRSE